MVSSIESIYPSEARQGEGGLTFPPQNDIVEGLISDLGIMKKIILIFSIALLLFSFNFCFANIDDIATNSLAPINEQDSQKLVGSEDNYEDRELLKIFTDSHGNLILANIGYLGILVTVFGILLGIIYLFNFKPFQKKLLDQENKQSEQGKEILEQQKKLLKIENFIKGELKRFKVYAKEQEKDRKELEKFSKKTISLLEEQKLDFFSRLEKQQISLEAEKSRSLALHSEKFETNRLIFFWWIKSAYHFYKLDENNLEIPNFINRAGEGLKNLVAKDAEWLKRSLPEAEEYIGALKEKYSEEIRRLEMLLVEKLNSLEKKEE